MLYRAKEDLLNDLKGVIDIQKNGVVKTIDKGSLRNKKIECIGISIFCNSPLERGD